MSSNPLVSIIIPNYNNGKYITQCIESIEAQTYSPIEIVIVDDVSTDDSREIINRLQITYENIITIFLEKNGGVSNARNSGADASHGEYLCFIDPDDFFWANDKIQNEMDLIQRHLEKGERIIAYSGVICVNEEGVRVDDRGLDGQLEGYIAPAYIARYRENKHSRNEIVDRETFFKAGYFDTKMSIWEDSDQFIRMLMIRPIYFTKKYGTAYRWKVDGLSSTSKVSGEYVLKQIEKKYKRQLSIFDRLQYYRYKFLRNVCLIREKIVPSLLHKGSVIKRRIIRGKQ